MRPEIKIHSPSDDLSAFALLQPGVDVGVGHVQPPPRSHDVSSSSRQGWSRVIPKRMLLYYSFDSEPTLISGVGTNVYDPEILYYGVERMSGKNFSRLNTRQACLRTVTSSWQYDSNTHLLSEFSFLTRTTREILSSPLRLSRPHHSTLSGMDTT